MTRRVVCLCAEWCGICRDYRDGFQSLAPRYPAVEFVWLDIDDEASWLDDAEVDTFPTLLVLDDATARFFGPLTPQPEVLARILDALDSQPTREVLTTPAWVASLARTLSLR